MKTKCKICHSETQDIERHFKKNKKSRLYRHCLNCDFIFLAEDYLISDEEEFQVYERHENSIEDPRYVAFFTKFINKAIIDYLETENPTCLDFGSGPEPVLAQLLEREFAWNVDIYDKFYAPEKVYQGKTYDLITTTEVVEHLADPLYYFRLFKELLAFQGRLSVMTLFHTTCPDFKKWFYINDPSHISFYSRKTMATIADIVGLKILYCNDHRYVTFAKRE